MLISVVAVGDCLGGVSLEDLAREGGLLLERRDVDSFWADPGLRPFDLAFVAYLDLPDEPAAAIRRIRNLPQRPEIAVLGIDLEARDTRG